MEKFTNTNYYKSLKTKEMANKSNDRNQKQAEKTPRSNPIEVEFSSVFSNEQPIAKLGKDGKIIHKTEAKGKVVFLTTKIKKYLREGEFYKFKGNLVDKGNFEMLLVDTIHKIVPDNEPKLIFEYKN